MADTVKTRKRPQPAHGSPMKRKKQTKKEVSILQRCKQSGFIKPFKQYLPAVKSQCIIKNNSYHQDNNLPEPHPQILGSQLKEGQGVYITYTISCNQESTQVQTDKDKNNGEEGEIDSDKNSEKSDGEENENGVSIAIYGKVIHIDQAAQKVVIHYADGQHIHRRHTPTTKNTTK